MDTIDWNGIPRPHYLYKAKLSDDGVKLNGVVIFPSSDPSIADRIDHVNVSHHLFALWNAAHLMAKKFGAKRILVKNLKVEIPRITKMDTPIIVKAEATDFKFKNKSFYGKLRGIFSDDKGVLADIEVEFAALKSNNWSRHNHV